MMSPSVNKFKLTLFALIGAGSLVSASAQPWRDDVKEPVKVSVIKRGEVEGKTFVFVNYIDDNLLFRVPDAVNQRELIAFPLDQFVPDQLKIELFEDDAIRESFKKLEEPETAKEGVEELRKVVWPLVKAIDLPFNQTDFDERIGAYLNALILTETVDEARNLALQLDFDRITPDQTASIVNLMELLLERKRSDDAFRLLGRLPLNNERQDLQDIAIRFGRELREDERYEEAVTVYERLFTLEKSSYRQKSILWTAYCYLKLGNLSSANIYLSLANDFEPRQQEFSLKRLIEGLTLLEAGESTKAMHAISEGVVFSRLGLEWIAELMLVSGKAYEAVGRPEVAGNVYRELIQFYPEDPFSKVARERLKELPEPSEKPKKS